MTDWLNSWRWPLAAIFASLAVAGLAGIGLKLYDAGRAARDAWWRQQVALATGKLTAEAVKAGAEIVASDEELIASVEGSAHAKEAAEGRVKTTGDDGDPSCPRLPARCLRW